jgi:hypothetical protein
MRQHIIAKNDVEPINERIYRFSEPTSLIGGGCRRLRRRQLIDRDRSCTSAPDPKQSLRNRAKCAGRARGLQSVFQSWLRTAGGEQRRSKRRLKTPLCAVQTHSTRGDFWEHATTNFVAPSTRLIWASPRLVNGQKLGAILRALATGLCTKSQKNRVWTRKNAFQKAINY